MAKTAPSTHDGENEVLPYALDERRRAALAEVDNAQFSIASVMLAYVYGHRHGLGAELKLGKYQELGIKVATPVGTLFGQLVFGWLADIVGRKKMYGVELIIITVATFGQAVSGGAHAVSIVGVLVVWRFIMGVGIGGDYPLSATISSEFASIRIRGRMMSAVFAAQGWGNLAACLVALVITAAYKNAILDDPDVDHLEHVDFMWRLLIGLGCVPGVIALYFRLTIPETPRFTMDIERNVFQAADDIKNVLTAGKFNVDPDAVVQRAEAPRASLQDFRAHFGRWDNMKVLIGTSYSWFALDIAFYGLGFNSSIILHAIGFGSVSITDTRHIYESLYNICVGNLILSVAGLIPGYWAAFYFIDSWGRKPIQLMGFIVLTITFICMGFGYDKLVTTTSGKNVFVFLYCLTNFPQNFGPNTTTFIIPGGIFPTRYRSTAHGISAASGKLGAIIAQVAFFQLIDIGGAPGSSAFVKHILQIFAFFMLTGVASTLLLPETKGQSLEKLSNENQENFMRGPTTRVEVRDGIVVGRRV
ncbi:phosphate transporter [Mycena rebaudengoi]|nr:phosphate transporter [Mycena rebaudengoi]